MWELNHKLGWVLKMDAFKLWCWRRLLRKPWPEQIKPVNPHGNQLWIFFGRIDPEAEASVLWPRDAKSWLTGKDPDPWKEWRQEKGITEDEMMRWHHWHNSITDTIDMSLSKLQEIVKDKEAWNAAAHGVAKSWTRISEWTAKYSSRQKQ